MTLPEEFEDVAGVFAAAVPLELATFVGWAKLLVAPAGPLEVENINMVSPPRTRTQMRMPKARCQRLPGTWPRGGLLVGCRLRAMLAFEVLSRCSDGANCGVCCTD
jgi:hypothetical protein